MEGDTFGVGDRVVLARHGAGTIRERVATPSDQFVVELTDGSVNIAVTDAPALMRHPMGAAGAQCLVQRLCDRTKGRGDLPELTSVRAFGRCSVEQQAEYMRVLYASPKALSGNEREIILAEEHVLLTELSLVLGVPGDVLRPALRRGDPRLRPATSSVPETKKIKLRGYEGLGTFVVKGGLLIGDPCYVRQSESETTRPDGIRGNYAAPARSGAWHGFVKIVDDENAMLLAVHDDYGSKVGELRKTGEELAVLWVDGAKIAILDAAVREDALFMSEEVDRIEVDGLVGERGCNCVSGGGDGTYPLSGVRVDNQLVVVWIDFT